MDLAVKEMVAGGGASGGGEEEGCVSEEALREEVDAAIFRLMADGTGLRDYANAAIGGKVVRHPARSRTICRIRGDTCRAAREKHRVLTYVLLS